MCRYIFCVYRYKDRMPIYFLMGNFMAALFWNAERILITNY